MKDKLGEQAKTAILDLDGADCASCAYAIEHSGRKVAGVSEVRVDIASREARVVYAGKPEVLEKIARIVRSLGYDAKVRTESVHTDDA